MTTLTEAIARSCTHTEIVECEFAGTENELRAWLNDNTAGGQTISRENDGTVDVADDAWRIRVTLVDLDELMDAMADGADDDAEAPQITVDDVFKKLS